jgi:hypothetical protein
MLLRGDGLIGATEPIDRPATCARLWIDVECVGEGYVGLGGFSFFFFFFFGRSTPPSSDSAAQQQQEEGYGGCGVSDLTERGPPAMGKK